MAIELAQATAIPKPWGVSDLKPWFLGPTNGATIGEIWYGRTSLDAPSPALLLKLLFTSQPLSIQVHPNDNYARSIGLANGKTEAWYILNATPGAAVEVGLKKPVTAEELREAVTTGSIVELMERQQVSAGDVIFVPAGTIHAIGAGIVIAEIQQRSDATFRLFDYGSQRELHVDSAIAVANTSHVETKIVPNHLSDERTLLISNQYFVLERLELKPATRWRLAAERETWFLVLSGGLKTAPLQLTPGSVIFAQSDSFELEAGANGLVALVAYSGPGGPALQLLQTLSNSGPTSAGLPKTQLPTSSTQAKAASSTGAWEIR